MERFEPTSTHGLWNEEVEVHSFGTRHGNWSMKGASSEEAERNNPGILERMSRLITQYRCRVYVPNPSTFNAAIVAPTAFDSEWLPGLWRGPLADGVTLLEPGTAFAVTSADCPTIVLQDAEKGTVAAAHAGRDSLWRNEGNQHRLVTDQMLMSLGLHRTRAICGFVACGISVGNFGHAIDESEEGRRNQQMINSLMSFSLARSTRAANASGYVSLNEAIREQLDYFGCIPSHRIGFDGVDTFGDTGRDGRPLWHSHRRDRNGARNLVLVIRRR